MEQFRTSVTLFCQVKTTARQPMHSNITWYRNHQQMKSDDQFHLNNYKLHVRGDVLGDGTVASKPSKAVGDKGKRMSLGGVRCGAHSAKAGMIFSKSFDLDALFERMQRNSVYGGAGGAVPPSRSRKRTGGNHQKRSSDSPRRIIAYTEDPITLNCRLSVSSADLVEWTRDGKRFRLSHNDGTVKEDGEEEIVNLII